MHIYAWLFQAKDKDSLKSSKWPTNSTSIFWCPIPRVILINFFQFGHGFILPFNFQNLNPCPQNRHVKP